MGKWAEVACNCPNRVRLPGGDSDFDRPHRRKGRLTAKQKAEVEEWERTRMNMFACGHRSGLIIELWPGDIIHVGYLLGSAGGALERFAAVGNPLSYESSEELLLLAPVDAEEWLLEIEEVRQALEGGGSLPRERIALLIEGFGGDREQIREALADAARLCRASIDTGNPVRLLW